MPMFPSPNPIKQQETRHQAREDESPKINMDKIVTSRPARIGGLRPYLSDIELQANADKHWNDDISPRLTSTQKPIFSDEEIILSSIFGCPKSINIHMLHSTKMKPKLPLTR
jgi:hypothetical protein